MNQDLKILLDFVHTTFVGQGCDECPVCMQETLTVPFCCGHALCGSCLAGIWRTGISPICCPLCRSIAYVEMYIGLLDGKMRWKEVGRCSECERRECVIVRCSLSERTDRCLQCFFSSDTCWFRHMHDIKIGWRVYDGPFNHILSLESTSQECETKDCKCLLCFSEDR